MLMRFVIVGIGDGKNWLVVAAAAAAVVVCIYDKMVQWEEAVYCYYCWKKMMMIADVVVDMHSQLSFW